MLWHEIHAIALGLCVFVEMLGIGGHFIVRQCLSVPEHCDLLIRIIQMETFYYNSSILRVEFHRFADAVGLLTGNQSGAAAAEQIHHYSVRSAAVLNRIAE